MPNELEQTMKGKRLIPFQAHDEFVELMDEAVERTREQEVLTVGEALTDRSKFIRAAIREKITRVGIAVTEAA